MNLKFDFRAGCLRLGPAMLFALPLLLLLPLVAHADIVADHTRTNITAVPVAAITAAKAGLHIAYGHTSHGSQLTSGMSGLVGFMNAKGYPANLYAYNNGGTGGALDLRDMPFSGASDLGNPNRTAWATATRNYLNTHPEINVIIWSWCGQVDGSQADIQLYLDLMTQLELEYPNVKFVYMTGHLNGTGAAGNVHQRNEQIRNHVRANNKILFDFADIESYDPDGLVNYMERLATDNCDYDSDGNGSLDRNWAIDWQSSHILNTDWYNCSSAHSQPLNANRKAYAAWWLWARLAGWNECVNSPSQLSAAADSVNQRITLTWQNNAANADTIVIQRRVNSGAWDNDYAVVPAGLTSFQDANLAAGIYDYRVVARAACGDSAPSNTTSGQITAPICVVAPSNLSATPNSLLGRISLAWQDNSGNEDSFIIQRQVNSGAWDNDYASVAAGTVAYTDSGLADGNYNYRVLAHRNACGDSTPSNTAGAQIVTPTLPDAPTNLSAQLSGANVALAFQDNAENETGFVIERHMEGQAFSQLAVLPANTTTYTDTAPLALHTYNYRVKARNDVGDSAYSNDAAVYVPQGTVNPVTIKLQTTTEVDDAFLMPASPNTNYGAVSYSGRTNPIYNFLIKFNLPAAVLDQKITEAKVGFYGWDPGCTCTGEKFNLLRVTQPWVESQVTWNHRSAGVPWNTPGGDCDQAHPIGQVDYAGGRDHAFFPATLITSTVQEWADATTPNYGMLLVQSASAARTGLKASEYNNNMRSYLEISYIPCQVDSNGDGDVDGADLAALAAAHAAGNIGCLKSLAAGFGR